MRRRGPALAGLRLRQKRAREARSRREHSAANERLEDATSFGRVEGHNGNVCLGRRGKPFARDRRLGPPHAGTASANQLGGRESAIAGQRSGHRLIWCGRAATKPLRTLFRPSISTAWKSRRYERILAARKDFQRLQCREHERYRRVAFGWPSVD